MARKAHDSAGKSDSRIARIQTFRLMCPLPQALHSSQARLLRRDALLVRVESASGAVGWGECAGLTELNETAIQSLLGPLALGRDALAPDVLWHDLWRANQPWGRRGAPIAALSGLDMAVWDLRGKLMGCSVGALIGGAFRDRIPCAAHGLYVSEVPETEIIPRLIEEAHGYVETGYRAVHAQVGRNANFDAALVRALRKALPATPLYADAGQAYDLPEAMRFAAILVEQNFVSFDEPLSTEMLDLYAQLAAHIPVPISAGKTEQTRWGFLPLLAQGSGVAVLRLDLSYCGGLTEALRIRALASAAGVNVLPYAGGTQINLAAALHFLSADFRQPGRLEPSLGILDCDAAPNPLREAIFSLPIERDGGLARVPTGPGLGVEIDLTELKFFCIQEREVAG